MYFRRKIEQFRNSGTMSAFMLVRAIVKINTSSACVFLVGDRNDQNIPHGKGKMMFHENEEGKMIYEGQWFKGRIQGFGTMTWKRGDV